MKIRPHKQGYRVDYRDSEGKRHQVKKSDIYRAREFASKVSDETEDLRKLLKSYRKETSAARTENTAKNLSYRCRTLLATLDDLGVKYPGDLYRGVFSELVKILKERDYSEQTIKIYASTFKSFIDWLDRSGYIRGETLGQMKLRGSQKKIKNYLSKEQITRLLNYLEDHWLQLPSALGIYAGLRRSEILGLTEGDIDKENKRIIVRVSKNNEVRKVPFHPELPKYLPPDIGTNGQMLARDVSPEWLSRKFSRITDDLGWEDITFHSLRHTCGTQMAKVGYSAQQIAIFLGHKSTDTTRQYVNLQSDDILPDW